MQVYCGEVYTIESISTNDNVIDFKESNKNWESWMFDLVDEKEEKDEEPRYRVGDKVAINSIDWYNANKDEYGVIDLEGGGNFVNDMKTYCGEECTISSSYLKDNQIYYRFEEIGYIWQSWMFSPALSNTKEDSTVSDEEELSIGDIIQFPSNSRYVIIDIVPKSKFYTTVEMSSGEVHYVDKTKSHTFAGKYLSDIDTKLDIKDRATLVRKSLNTIIEIGDVIKDKEGDHFIIIGYNSEERIYDVVDSHWDCNRIYRTKDLTIVEKGKYKDLIDTSLSGEAIARSLRNREGVIRMSESIREADKIPVPKPYSKRWAKLIAVSFISEDNNSQSNFSKFDLSKVMYKSKIIK